MMGSIEREYENIGVFCSKQDIDKAAVSLLGLVEGVLADGIIQPEEITALKDWLSLYERFLHNHPFSEFVPELKTIISTGKVDVDYLLDIEWLCKRYHDENNYYDVITSSIQELQGICQGIFADGRITAEELRTLEKWLDDHEELKCSWPYESLCTLVNDVLQDGIVDEREERMLKRFFWEFIETDKKKVIYNPPAMIDGTLKGVCSLNPDVEFAGKNFCFTGKSSVATRNEISSIVKQAGGNFINNVSKKIDYLIIGDNGSHHWAFSCYGRKVEKAVELRKEGSLMLLIHEHDFWEALRDEGVID